MAERPLASYSGDQPFLFVSYGHKDGDLVYPEMRWLQEAGFNLWYDEGIHVGAVWRKAIADALSAASGMLFIATASSVESDNCLKELNFVLDEGKPIFVIRLDDTKLPSLLRLSLSDRQMLNRAEFSEAEYRTRLIQALSTVTPPTPRETDEPAKVRRITTKIPSIGVQALAAADETNAFWAEGMIDDLATRLGHRWFGISRAHDATKDLAALGRALGVGYVLSGNVRRSGDRFRVNLKLTVAATGVQIWGARYDEGGDDIDAADAISRIAAIDISTAIMREEQQRVDVTDLERLDAWELCVGAQWNVSTIKDRETTLTMLRLATQRDPSFPMPHSILGNFLCVTVTTMFSRMPEQDIAEGLKAVDRSLALAPGNPLVMQGAVTPHRMFGDEDLAFALAERANAAGGSDAMFGGRGMPNQLYACLIQRGREVDAIELMLASRPPPEALLSTAYSIQSNWTEALAWAQREATTSPDFFLAWINVANALAMLDRRDEATEIMRKVKTMVPTFKLSYYEKGTRLGWRNRERVVDALLAGLRKLEID